MEKRLNRKSEEYFIDFKTALKNEVTSRNISDDDKHGIMKFIYDYENLSFDKTDFQKRKRTKNIVPFDDRCTALRANKQQCTRRKKGDNVFCGTHIKGQPHGTLELSSEELVTTKKVEVWPEEIYGIIYYIDNAKNVYSPEDIMADRKNPKVIYKYNKDMNGCYHIEEINCPEL
jgi:hypothetical protein